MPQTVYIYVIVEIPAHEEDRSLRCRGRYNRENGGEKAGLDQKVRTEPRDASNVRRVLLFARDASSTPKRTPPRCIERAGHRHCSSCSKGPRTWRAECKLLQQLLQQCSSFWQQISRKIFL